MMDLQSMLNVEVYSLLNNIDKTKNNYTVADNYSDDTGNIEKISTISINRHFDLDLWDHQSLHFKYKNKYDDNDYFEQSRGSGYIEENSTWSYLKAQDHRKLTKSESSSGNKYFCKIAGCLSGFKRSEHLHRHLRMHTGEKPYGCVYPECGESFSRFDNMIQHTKTHKKNGKICGAGAIINLNTRPNRRKTKKYTIKSGTESRKAQFFDCELAYTEEEVQKSFDLSPCFSMARLKPIHISLSQPQCNKSEKKTHYQTRSVSNKTEADPTDISNNNEPHFFCEMTSDSPSYSCEPYSSPLSDRVYDYKHRKKKKKEKNACN